ncbi:Rrf2 family transcriptional regulator [Spiribacter vilamensis]|uniref:BadM/Rrf2 family transcriptional regulator n=1 Tax=Spiribacter vilamensis TaxID=531306 RepID=A0A4Q8CZN2_9GAMM|nr:Rrf2 family transcriptional regulator [Spiribacter vilamensis]RZU98496.1 BadM/Rrf2 family transcriptional regulator [Spiribacter vilamensis]TVO60636.1 Rrf2 family transcriptional regulator [Spiribacter vilamensis]
MIRLSAKSRYAVSALLHLAVHNQAGAVPLAEISVCQGISMSYIDQIFWKLRRAGLVRGTPGPGGGYRLGRDPEAISMGEVITLMDGQGGPRRATSALDAQLWAGLADRIEAFLNGITLADFAARPEIRDALVDQYNGGGWRCDICGALSTRQQPSTGASGA